MFDLKSRYLALPTYQVMDRRGRVVTVVTAAPDPGETLLGLHLRRDGQRIDHLAAHYLDDAAAFWRIAELADAMLPESLSEARDIPIPTKVR